MFSCAFIALSCNENIGGVALVIDRSPEITPLSTDVQENFVEVPLVSWLCPATLQPSGILGTELEATAPHGFIAQNNAALEHQFLDLAKRHPKAVVEANAVANDLGREAVAFVKVGTNGLLTQAWSLSYNKFNVTMPP